MKKIYAPFAMCTIMKNIRISHLHISIFLNNLCKKFKQMNFANVMLSSENKKKLWNRSAIFFIVVQYILK